MTDPAASQVSIGDLKLNGGKMRADLADAITTTALTETITGASQLQLTVHDPQRTVLRSPLCAARSTITVEDLTFSLTQINKSGNLVTLTFEDYAVAVLRRHHEVMKAAAGAVSRVEFCRKVIAKDAPWIVVDGPSAGPTTLEELAIGTITNFADVTAGDTATASTSGARIIPAHQVAQYAKDAGFTGSALVVAVAVADAESSFNANNVHRNSDQWQSRDRGLWQINDHYHPEFSDAQCFDPAECAVIAYKLSSGGHDWSAWSTYTSGAYRQFLGDAQTAVDALKPSAQTTAADSTGQRGENHWAGITRIMAEIGWRTFARRGHIVIAPDSWLLTQPALRIAEFTGGVDTIDFDADPRKPVSTVTVDCRAHLWAAAPGEPVTITGLGPADDTYLASQIGPRSLAHSTVTVTLIKKQRTLPEPAANANSGAAGITAQLPKQTLGASSAQVQTMVDFALAQAGKRYLMGGNGPDDWDCSGLVLAATRAAGDAISARVANDQYAACVAAGSTISVSSAINTCGALLFEPGSDPGGTYGIGHVAISLGNGQTIEARGTAYGVGRFSATEGREWTYAGLVPHMDYRVPGA